MGKRFTINDFIDRSIDIHGDVYNYSLVEYKNNKTKVKIICKEHGIFEQMPLNHINSKAGCRFCYGNIKLTTNEFIKRSNYIHENKYDYSLVEYKNDKTKVDIICNKHGIFKQCPGTHLKGHGCLLCTRIDTEIFIQKSKEIYSEEYDYSESVYVDRDTPIKIKCKKHNYIFIKVNNFLYNKSGCTYCAKNRYKNIDYLIDDANKVHNNKFTYEIIDDLDKSSYINITCKEHGVFKQRISSHISDGVGCKKCSDDYKRKDKDILIDEFKDIHANKYDYSLVEYKNNISKIKIICKKHNIFEQSPKRHLSGDGCPSCSESKGENKIYNFLIDENIYFERQKKFNNCVSKKLIKLRFDFYLPELNICIEYDGEQHFIANEYFGGIKALEKCKINDSIKNKYCEDNNIKLLRIDYYDFKNIKNILIDYLKIEA